MTVNGIGNRTFLEKIAGSGKKTNGKEKDYGNVAGGFEKKPRNLQEEKQANSQTPASGNIQVDYHSGSSKISRMLAVTEAGRIHAESTIECEAKHISYAESDSVKVYAESGYALKAKTILDEHKVYIEQKTEDGQVKGYMVNPLKVPGDSENPIELLAKECWEATENAFNDGKFTEARTEEDTKAGGKTYQEALVEFYEFVEDRVKNGPPKFQTGGAEFSIEEWDKLMEEVDGAIDAFKEEMRQRIAKEKEEANLSTDTEERQLAIEGEPEKKEAGATNTHRGIGFDEVVAGASNRYARMADENGEIKYNGVTFQYDKKKKQITLGDVSDKRNVLGIQLSNGCYLKVNRDNLGDLTKAIGMFSPEDINLILRAIARDNKAREMEFAIEKAVKEAGIELIE